jgi:GT2 family glycosyltransferase
MELGADYVLLLNPDTRTPVDTLRRLVTFAEEWPEYGIIGPLQYRYTPDGRPTAELNEWSTVALRRGEANIHVESWPDHPSHASPLTGRAPRTLEYAYVQAAAFLCRVEVLRGIGLLDATYHTYYEETDLCRRARWAGWRVALLLDVGVQHHGGGNTGHSLYRRRLMLRNKYYFLFTDPEWAWSSALRLAGIWLRLDLTRRSDVPAPTRAGAWNDTIRGLWWLMGKVPRLVARRRALRSLRERGSGGPLRLDQVGAGRDERR